MNIILKFELDVIPAKAGIQGCLASEVLDAASIRHDGEKTAS
jgi:hypothetical protein